MIRAGFIVDGQVPTAAGCIRYGNPWALLLGWGSRTPVAEMRFRWIADYINRSVNGVRYELYRPWRKYHAVVFLKSMTPQSISLQQTLRRHGTKTLFDANVDYFSEATGTFFYEGMAPSREQQTNARQMARDCNGVIADSGHIEEVVRQFNRTTATITDNVPDRLVAAGSVWRPDGKKPLELVWCGQAVKLFELLAVEELLLTWHDRIVLKIITNSMEYIKKWYPPHRMRFESLLQRVPHRIVPFASIDSLMTAYDAGGVFIAPRYLDNSYNLGHTEWKITLPMARGRMVLCSPQPSYCQVAEKSTGRGIRICDDPASWSRALEELMAPSFDWAGEQQAAAAVVREHYTTTKVADTHLRFLRQILEA